MLALLDTLIGFAAIMLGISLIITILNQVASSLLAHRGANLRWALDLLLSQIQPGTQGLPVLSFHSSTIAELVLTHPLASDSVFSTAWVKSPFLQTILKRWKLANAIHPDELTAVLQHIATFCPEGMHPGVHAILSAEIQQLLGMPSPVAERQVELATTVVPAAASTTAAIATAATAVNVSATPAGELEAWFNQVTDRASQRFTMWMRAWTVVFSFGIAFICCIDSIQLLPQIYRDGQLRSQLASAATQMTDAAKKYLPATGTSESAEQHQIFTDALTKAATAAGITLASRPDVANEAQVRQWIQGNVPMAQQQQVLSNFESNWRDQMSGRLQAVGQIYATLSTDLPKLGPGNWSRQKDEKGYAQRLWKQALGVLISALLLSLGAPFWFNTLSSLTNLRPQVAAKANPPQTTNK